jgi:hypothetical protein
MTDEDTLALFADFRGRSITRLRRVMFVCRDKIDDTSGPLELSFDDGSTLLFDAGPDGEALAVKPAAWIAYFTEPISAKNQEFILRSGKWTGFDVSGQPPYSQLISTIVQEITPVRTPEDKIKGAIIMTSSCVVRVEVEADEMTVDIA